MDFESSWHSPGMSCVWSGCIIPIMSGHDASCFSKSLLHTIILARNMWQNSEMACVLHVCRFRVTYLSNGSPWPCVVCVVCLWLHSPQRILADTLFFTLVCACLLHVYVFLQDKVVCACVGIQHVALALFLILKRGTGFPWLKLCNSCELWCILQKGRNHSYAIVNVHHTCCIHMWQNYTLL